MSSDGNFKAVGRFELIKFEAGGTEPVAIIGFDGVGGAAHVRMGADGSAEKFSSIGLALLVDCMPEGEERDYLDVVHAALEELVDANFRVIEQIEDANSMRDASDDNAKEYIEKARTLLAPLYRR
ncbi:hypothetical protein [Rhodopila sp.]|uniref:hypothetical protein n=1 Tax=Rhodopila sp. TaxID=2480087 RepID=UPI003D13ACB9